MIVTVLAIVVAIACAVAAGILRRRSEYRRAVDDLRVATEEVAAHVGAALLPAVKATGAAFERFVRRVES